ncbi:type II toxin-antitoxin system RelE/ParE family toxin [Candidatus Poribacteria bacterium]|nr:type II toxin-antitoxin system RelE/ParE family toxin [Candidatus Poribacteria bacterium]
MRWKIDFYFFLLFLLIKLFSSNYFFLSTFSFLKKKLEEKFGYQTESGDYPVAEFMENLPEKAQEKVIDYLDLLAEHGIQLGMPYVKDISGVRKLKELRIRYSSNIYRIFFFAFTGQKFILLHAITKKTQKTPKSDLLYSLEFLNFSF